MTAIIKEISGSRSLERSSDSYTGTRSFVVYDDEGLSLTINEIMNNEQLPSFGDAHPEVESIFASSWTLQLKEDLADAWEVVWSYTDDYVDSGGSDNSEEEDDVDDVFTDISVNIGVTLVDAWKSDPTMPTNKDNPARTDIGGTEIHEGGNPVTHFLPTADISITGTITTQTLNAGGALNLSAKRNAEAWLGFDAGSVVFIGVDIKKIGTNLYELTYKLAWDKWYHLRQMPNPDPDGNPKVVSTATPTLDVFFKQPFKNTTSFSFLPIIT
tara:strand:- start:783 stop:1592 length:810 start_codon:yes stop_codon:yes gene_type:complete